MIEVLFKARFDTENICGRFYSHIHGKWLTLGWFGNAVSFHHAFPGMTKKIRAIM